MEPGVWVLGLKSKLHRDYFTKRAIAWMQVEIRIAPERVAIVFSGLTSPQTMRKIPMRQKKRIKRKTVSVPLFMLAGYKGYLEN